MSDVLNSYKQIIEARRAQDHVQDLTLPSGSTWKVSDPPLAHFMSAGKLPPALVEKMVAIAKESGGDPQAVLQITAKRLGPDDMVSFLIVTRDMLLHCVREPRISTETPTPEDAIAPEDILPEDFAFLRDWMWSGGAAQPVTAE
jgi:hypothetical protein